MPLPVPLAACAQDVLDGRRITRGQLCIAACEYVMAKLERKSALMQRSSLSRSADFAHI